MVKKLFKHEFIAYMRALLPMHIILLGVAALTRFVWLFEDETTVFRIVGVSSIIALVVAGIVCLVLTFTNTITRFYRNMFRNEGYLTLTLPVTNTQHILVKMLTGVSVIVSSFLFVFVAACVATAGEFTVELFKALGYLAKTTVDAVGAHYYFYMFEVFVNFLVGMGSGLLLFYACIALGQLSNKNRKGAAIGVYFAYYFINQILGTIGLAIFSGIQELPFVEKVIVFFLDHPNASIHLVLIGGILWTAFLGLIYFAVTNYVMKKKLNLE